MKPDSELNITKKLLKNLFNKFDEEISFMGQVRLLLNILSTSKRLLKLLDQEEKNGE